MYVSGTKSCILASVFAFSAILVCILPLYRLRYGCGNMRRQRSRGLLLRPVSIVPHYTFCIPQFRILPTDSHIVFARLGILITEALLRIPVPN